jgi:hypothetical protein
MIDIILNKERNLDRGISTVFFKFGDRFFPQDGWTDFDTAIELWCLDLSEDGSSDILFFMDGPYKFSVDKKGDAFQFRFFENYDHELKEVDRYQCSKENYDYILKKLNGYFTLVSSAKN